MGFPDSKLELLWHGSGPLDACLPFQIKHDLADADYKRYVDGGRPSSASIFVGGFVLGGIVVGALGCIYAPQISKALAGADRKDLMKKLSKFICDEEKALERTRKILTEKIAQLNSAIDDVSSQLRADDTPNGTAQSMNNVTLAAASYFRQQSMILAATATTQPASSTNNTDEDEVAATTVHVLISAEHEQCDTSSSLILQTAEHDPCSNSHHSGLNLKQASQQAHGGASDHSSCRHILIRNLTLEGPQTIPAAEHPCHPALYSPD
ncbi:hypothetical protein TEA_016622 [Camellia sinensis var. sinensis]|uniref:Uncharacterized protein n=1 Tax=Camellia sinensis var. sinensis TaxID=542762 RepID=A0A4S4DUE9_CAMSN|nr:hypothetical protein TEA_016622 [Camellia sinensis var. sinensis]